MNVKDPPRSPRRSGPGERDEFDAIVAALIEEARQRQRRRRRMYGALAVLPALAGVALFMGLGRTAGEESLRAASGPAGAAAGGTLKGKVEIKIDGKRLGPATGAGTGRFTISGLISDHGRYVDSDGVITVRKLIGTKGTIWMKVGFIEPLRCQCNWRVVKGTGAYAGLRGRGGEGGAYEPVFVDVMMTGTFWMKQSGL